MLRFYRFFTIFTMLLQLSACTQPEDSSYKSDNAYPFSESSKKSTSEYTNGLQWIRQTLTNPKNFQSGLENAIFDFVPFSFTGEESFAVGKLDTFKGDNILRYQVVVQIDQAMKVYLEIFDDQETVQNWEWLRVSAYYDGYRYLKTFHNDFTKK